jgi:8-amino-7-oxononanoate synthase
MGGLSSRLLTGNHPEYGEVEKLLADRYGKERALVFASGYHANLGILSCIAGRGDAIFSDRLNHASLIDGMRLSGAAWFRYHHLDTDHLAQLLRENRSKFRNAFIVSESVFSMDGDLADLRRLVRLKHEHDAVLMVDEAHAFGVFGDSGLGVCETDGCVSEIDIIVGTFGKAAGSFGAFCVTDGDLGDFLVNHARTLIFATALPPINLAWTRWILAEVLPARRERAYRLLDMSLRFRTDLRNAGFDVRGNSQIVPVILGENRTAVEASARLKDAGFYAMPVRPPTVPRGTSRIRFSLTTDISERDLAGVPEILGRRADP